MNTIHTFGKIVGYSIQSLVGLTKKFSYHTIGKIFDWFTQTICSMQPNGLFYTFLLNQRNSLADWIKVCVT